MMRRSIVAAGAALLVAAAPAPPAHADDPMVVRIGYNHGSEPLNVSRLRGTLEARLAKLNVRVTWTGPFAAYAPAAEALQSNSIDVAVGSSTAAISTIAGNLPVSIFAFQKNPGDNEGIVVKDDSPIRTLHDLIGKTVAVNHGGSGEYLLAKALQSAGIPEDQVQRAYLSPVDSAQAFVSGHVDAWAAWSVAYPQALIQYHARPIATAAQIHSANAVVYVVRNDFAKAHPEVVSALIDDLRASNQWALRNKAQAAQLWVGDLKLDPVVAKAVAASEPLDPSPVTTAERADFEQTARWMLDEKIIPQPAPIDDHVWYAPR